MILSFLMDDHHPVSQFTHQDDTTSPECEHANGPRREEQHNCAVDIDCECKAANFPQELTVSVSSHCSKVVNIGELPSARLR